MFQKYFQQHIHAQCSLCFRGVDFDKREVSKAKLEKVLRQLGWQEIEIQTPQRVFGGLACDFCAQLCEEGVYEKAD